MIKFKLLKRWFKKTAYNK